MDSMLLFERTMQIIDENPELSARTERAAADSHIIWPGFRSEKSPMGETASVSVEEMLTLISARKLVDKGYRTAVLNFANPSEPGGGVTRGAEAQEEYLCRAGNLYKCLTAEHVAEYYRVHQQLEKAVGSHRQLGTDALIYSPGVTIFRDDTHYIPGSRQRSRQAYTPDWYEIDVITCGAPYFSGPNTVLPPHELEPLLVSRIENILEAAIEHSAEALVLGAFGCGVFNNPPRLVAEAFAKVLARERYLHAFREIIFAIRTTKKNDRNAEAFKEVFAHFPPGWDELFAAIPNEEGEI